MPYATHNAPARSRWLAALGVFVVALAAAVALIATLEHQERNQRRVQALQVAADHANALLRGLELALSANNVLVALVREGNGRVDKFQEIGEQLLPLYPGIAAMGLSPNGVVRYVVPEVGNESLIGFDQINDPRQGPDARRARDSRQLTLAGPLELVQGGLGVVGRHPVYLFDAKGTQYFWGLTYVTIRLPALLDAARVSQLPERGYRYRLWRDLPGGAGIQSISGSPTALGEDAVTHALDLPNGRWYLSVEPLSGWGSGGVLGVRVVMGLLFAALMAYLVHTLLRLRHQERGLAAEVSRQTAEIRSTQSQLRAVIDAIPDALIELDSKGHVLALHGRQALALVAPLSAAGSAATLMETLPSESAALLRVALDQAAALGQSTGVVLDWPGTSDRPLRMELSISLHQSAAHSDGTLRFIALARNVSDREAAQADMRLASQVFDQSSEAIVIADGQRRVVRTNLAFSHMSGYAPHEVLGKPVDALADAGHPAGASLPWLVGPESQHWEGETLGRRKDGSTYPQWLSVSHVRHPDSGEIVSSILLLRDITQLRETQARIEHLAHYDHLTNLPSRALLAERVGNAIRECEAQGGTLALLFVDLDHFKNVNDSLGHRTGDALLVAIAQRLQSIPPAGMTVSRLGGDEFVLLVPQASAQEAAVIANRVLQAIAEPVQLQPYELTTTSTIGIALFPNDGDSFDMLYQRADAAMYRAKQSGRNRFAFFTAEIEARSARTLQIENALRRAIERGQLSLHYQPQVELRERRIVGAEALLRWQHPEWGWVSPAEFIPVAESSGLIVGIGEWVLRTACRDARAWLDAGLDVQSVSVNLSAVQFRHPQLAELVDRCLEEAQLPPWRLELELTEGAAVDDPAHALTIMERLHARGIRLSMDDFGTGYSSLSYLKRFQISKLKIDQSFVRDLDEDANDRAIVSAIVRMAQALGMQTTAEGVETEGQMAFLREQGCDEAQGYLLSRPLPADDFMRFVRSHRPLPAPTPAKPHIAEKAPRTAPKT
ncbi:bifunctional diguanylate cyclase/phosphodiesterase [Acidovorax lacteus]|uniref:bifunctional diguanylate cyclase/phosphodiesterase n=1 Tax=Acidovorax lacteus TaxID=1924988 RepID=UPI0031E8A201